MGDVLLVRNDSALMTNRQVTHPLFDHSPEVGSSECTPSTVGVTSTTNSDQIDAIDALTCPEVQDIPQ